MCELKSCVGADRVVGAIWMLLVGMKMYVLAYMANTGTLWRLFPGRCVRYINGNAFLFLDPGFGFGILVSENSRYPVQQLQWGAIVYALGLLSKSASI